MFDMMKKFFILPAGTFILCASFMQAATGQTTTFPVEITRSSTLQCSLTGSMLNIDPASGKVSIDLNADFNCYPAVVSQINSATLSASPTNLGAGTGQGTVNLTLTTGLPSGPSVPGVNCYPDGVTPVSGSVNVVGWNATTPLCPTGTGCGASVAASVSLLNPSITVPGKIRFNAKCIYQNPGSSQYQNLSTVRSNITSQEVTVQPSPTAPPADFCASVNELADPRGLSDAMRQGTTNISGGTFPGNGKDALNYTSIFGIAPDTGNSSSGFGFPGTSRSTFKMTISRNQYVSMKFRVPETSYWSGKNGDYLFTPPPSSAALTLGVIAPCPGQFHSDPNFPINESSCRVIGKASLYAQIAGPSTGICRLEAGKTYYFNIIQANGFNNLTTPSCGGSSCGAQISVSGFATP